jgi:hypothetical protein
MPRLIESENKPQTDTGRRLEAVSQSIYSIALMRAQGLQETLDDLCERSPDTDLMKLADRADTQLIYAREALQNLNYALAIRAKLEAEKAGVA